MLCKCLYPEIFDILLRYHFMDCAQASWESCFRCGAWVRILAVPPPVRTQKKTTPRSMIRDGFFIDAESYGEALRLSCSFWTTKPGCKLGRKKTEEVISWHTDFLLVDLWKVYLKTRGLFFWWRWLHNMLPFCFLIFDDICPRWKKLKDRTDGALLDWTRQHVPPWDFVYLNCHLAAHGASELPTVWLVVFLFWMPIKVWKLSPADH